MRIDNIAVKEAVLKFAPLKLAPLSKLFRRLPAILAVLGFPTTSIFHASSANADSASCIAKVSAYVAELDQLLSKEKNWITPYFDLNERYLPFRDCEADALLEVVSRSRFIQPIDYNPRLKEYFIVFLSDEVDVGFTYLASEKKSSRGHSGWVHK